MPTRTVLSHFQAAWITKAVLDNAHKVKVSLDLGMTTSLARIDYRQSRVFFSSDTWLSFDEISAIASSENACFVVESGKHSSGKVQFFSADTGRFYRLIASKDAPAAGISGITAQSSGTTWQHADSIVSLLAPLSGNVLDTCAGLGYCSVLAAKADAVKRVFAFEDDKNLLLLADYNPWSRPLFSDRKIRLAVEDITTAVKYFDDGFFPAVIHSPRQNNPGLCSADFYSQLYRVLEKGGRLFHSLSSSAGIVAKRLKTAGFSDVVKGKKADGIIATK